MSSLSHPRAVFQNGKCCIGRFCPYNLLESGTFPCPLLRHSMARALHVRMACSKLSCSQVPVCAKTVDFARTFPSLSRIMFCREGNAVSHEALFSQLPCSSLALFKVRRADSFSSAFPAQKSEIPLSCPIFSFAVDPS